LDEAPAVAFSRALNFSTQCKTFTNQ
jgi:hypothetical protein